MDLVSGFSILTNNASDLAKSAIQTDTINKYMPLTRLVLCVIGLWNNIF
jgi:hypothetical protein